jgi:lysophospholipase L1-like esterase
MRRRAFASRLVLAASAVLLLLPAALGAQGGGVDFGRYVALGDSLTAGFASGGLAIGSQQGSYPLLLHDKAVGGDFQQPLVSNPGIPAQLRLASLVPLLITPKSGLGHPLNLNLPRPYDNLGVPGARIHDTVATVTDHGGLHDLILRGLGTALQQAAALHPTFVTVWIGNNDVLAAATSGIVIEGVTLTPAAQFNHDLQTIASTLSATGAKMAFATIPRVTSIPFVTTIPPVVVNPATQQPVLVNGQTVPLIGPDGPLGANDRVLLTAQAELGAGKGIPAALGGSGQPLSNSVVLSANEVAQIQARADQFNSMIRDVASQQGAALVDVERIFDQIVASGYSAGGVHVDAKFLTGGLFSYDGVHPTPFGYALIADAFAQAIDAKYGSHIGRLNLARVLNQGGATQEPLTQGQARSATLTVRAINNWRNVLRLPSQQRLEQLAAHQGGGGGGGGNSGSGHHSNPRRHHRHRHG